MPYCTGLISFFASCLQRIRDCDTSFPSGPSWSRHFPHQSPHLDYRCRPRSHTPLKTPDRYCPKLPSKCAELQALRLSHYRMVPPRSRTRSLGLFWLLAERARLAWFGLLMKQKWPGLQRTLAWGPSWAWTKGRKYKSTRAVQAIS